MILVHQMAKVASLTWVEAARTAAVREGAEPLHSHFVTDANLVELADVLAWTGARQTIANRLIPNDFVRKGRAAAAAVAAARGQGRIVRLICGVRDPVARSLSLATFLADFCGHKGAALSGRDGGASVADARAALVRAWEAVLADRAPSASYEWLLWRMVGLYRSWFDEELRAPFGVDVLAKRGPTPGGGLRLAGEGCEVLVYRVEDMDPAASGHNALRAAAGDFLGIPLAAWDGVNRSESRERSREFNERLRAELRLPTEVLDAIYGEQAVRTWYGTEEIAEFRARWG